MSLAPSPLGENETFLLSTVVGTSDSSYLPVSSVYYRLLSDAESVTPSGVLAPYTQ